MGIAIIALFLIGVLVVILNYAGLLPGGVNNLWLVAAIGSIFAGLIMATLLNELERTQGRYGLLTMSEGGGMANATIIERLG